MEMIRWILHNIQLVGPSGDMDPYSDVFLPYLWNVSWTLHWYKTMAGNDVTSLGDTTKEQLGDYVENMVQNNTDLGEIAHDCSNEFTVTLTWCGDVYQVFTKDYEEIRGKQTQFIIMNSIWTPFLVKPKTPIPPRISDQCGHLISIWMNGVKRCHASHGKFSTQLVF